MPTISNTTVSTNSALLKGVSPNPGAGGATQVPPGILALPAGTVLNGEISKIDRVGNAILTTLKGDVSLQTDIPLRIGSEVALRLTTSNQGVRAKILSVDGLSPREFTDKATNPRGQDIHVDDIVQTGKKNVPAKTSAAPAQTTTSQTPANAATLAATNLNLPAEAFTIRSVLLSRSPELPQLLQALPPSITVPAGRLDAGAILTVKLNPQSIQLPTTPSTTPAAPTPAATTNTPAQAATATPSVTAPPSTTTAPAPTATNPTQAAATATTPTTTAASVAAANSPTATPTTTPQAPANTTTTPSTSPAATAPTATASTNPATPAATTSATSPATTAVTSTPASSASAPPTTTPSSVTTPPPATSTTPAPAAATTQTPTQANPPAAQTTVPTATTTTPTTATSTPPVATTNPATTQTAAATPTSNNAPVPPTQPTATPSATATPTATTATTASTPTAVAGAASTSTTPPTATSTPTVTAATAATPSTTTNVASAAAVTPNSPLPPPTQLAQGQIPAQVIGHEQSGETVVKTALGTLKISIPSPSGAVTNLPIGTQFTLTLESITLPQNLAQIAQPTSNSPAPLSELSMQWRSLQEAVQIIAASQPALAAHILDTIIPKPGPKMAAAMLFFLSVMRGGDIRQWMGEEALKILEQNKRSDLVRKLTAEMGTLRQFFVDSPSPNWQAAFVPVHDGEKWQQAGLFLKKEPESGDEEAQGTRFIMEIDLSNLGMMQFDGFIRKQEANTHFDLIIRSQNTLSDVDRQNIRDIYEGSAELTGLKGGISFQVTNPFPILPMKEILADAPDVMA